MTVLILVSLPEFLLPVTLWSWRTEPLLRLEFTLDDGRPAADLGQIVLAPVIPEDASGEAQEPVGITSGLILADGSLTLSSLSRAADGAGGCAGKS